MARALVAAGVALGLAAPAPARAQAAPPADPLATATIVYARAGSLYRADARGKGEVELAPLPAGAGPVRALRTDGAARALIANLGGTWWWMPLDGSARTLALLPCAAGGPAQLATDAACVLCRSASNADQALIVNLATGRQTPVPVPPPGARLVGSGGDRRLVWADRGIWSAPAGRPADKKQVAPEAPLRDLLPSPDGARAVGVYLDEPIAGTPGAKVKPAELLMGFALDGIGARRKGIRAGIPLAWSHDNHWVLVQDGTTACLMRAIGGQYKCWRGYIGASLAPDGSYALLLGVQPIKPDKGAKAPAPPAAAAPPAPGDDIAVVPPVGPVVLYRAKLDGAYTDPPVSIARGVEGAAVWIPPAPATGP